MMCGNLEFGGALMDIGVWLRSLGLEQYEAAFRDNEINERVLPNLTQEDLKEIGVGPVVIAGYSSKLSLLCAATPIAKRPPPTHDPSCPERLNRRPRRAPPSHSDVLRLGRLNGSIGAHGP